MVAWNTENTSNKQSSTKQNKPNPNRTKQTRIEQNWIKFLNMYVILNKNKKQKGQDRAKQSKTNDSGPQNYWWNYLSIDSNEMYT